MAKAEKTINPRIIPNNLEAEQAVLASVFLDEDCLPNVIAKLSTKDFFAEVVFTTSRGLELGRAYCHVDGMRTNADGDLYFRRVEKRVGSRIIRGAIIPRSRSPWAFINPERYDLIRSDGGFVQSK